MRVYELAKELGIAHKELVTKIRGMGILVNNHMSVLEADVVQQVKDTVEKERQQEMVETQVTRTVFRRRSRAARKVVQPDPVPAATPAEQAEPGAVEVTAAAPGAEVAAAQAAPITPATGAQKVEAVTPTTPEGVEQVPADTAAPAVTADPVTPVAAETVPVTVTAVQAQPTQVSPTPVDAPAQDATVVAPPAAPVAEAADIAVEAAKPAEAQEVAAAAPEVTRVTDTPAAAVPAEAALSEEKPRAREDRKEKTRRGARKEATAPGAEGARRAGDKRTPDTRKRDTTARQRPTETQAVLVTRADSEEIAARVRETAYSRTSGYYRRDGGGPGGRGDRSERAPQRRRGHRETITRRDIFSTSDRFSGGRRRRGVPKKTQKPQLTTPKAIKRIIRIEDGISVSELARQMGVKAADLIRRLMANGVMATINQIIDPDTAAVIASEFDYEVENVAFQEEVAIDSQEDAPEDLLPRAPVITIMGHVDHGKTSLLDRVRDANVAKGEHGGITQHIGAYNVHLPQGKIVFLDTPGHEAFTSMRARGANCTDIVVLVVAANDGVMPQTVEAVNHALEAKVPIIVAMNKMDLPEANPERITTGLSELGLIPEDWGGDTMFVPVSAKSGTGIDDLLENILLQTEVMELTANPDKRAKGIVLEAKLDTGRGVVATVLVQEGTLRVGDPIVAGTAYGKVRAMNNEHGVQITEAKPSTPIEVLGLNSVPEAGDMFNGVPEDRDAKTIATHRDSKARDAEMRRRAAQRTDINALFSAVELKELKVIIKGDVQGSVEAVKEALLKLSNEKVKLSVIHAGVGGVTESDVMLASAANKDTEGTGVMIVSFNIRANPKVIDLANDENIKLSQFTVIYDAVDQVRKNMAGLLEPTLQENYLGRAEVRQTFSVPRVGTVAGCMVQDGKIVRNGRIRLLRDSVQVFEGKISSLKRFKNDAREVVAGFECGIGLEGYNDIHLGDIIESYEIQEIAATM